MQIQNLNSSSPASKNTSFGRLYMSRKTLKTLAKNPNVDFDSITTHFSEIKSLSKGLKVKIFTDLNKVYCETTSRLAMDIPLFNKIINKGEAFIEISKSTPLDAKRIFKLMQESRIEYYAGQR